MKTVELARRLEQIERRLSEIEYRQQRGLVRERSGGQGGGSVTVGSTTPQVTADGSAGSASTAMRSDAQPRGQIGDDASATPDAYQFFAWESGVGYYDDDSGSYAAFTHWVSSP
jgi:hypothetical protein